MKLIHAYTIALLAVLQFNSFTMHAQPAPSSPLYIAFTYIKILPGKRDAYLNLLHQYSPKITAHRIAQGGILGWYIYEVKLPSGAVAPYDFVSITVANDFVLHFESLTPSDELMKSIVPGASKQTISEIFETYETSRTIIKKEISVQISNLFPEHAPARYVLADYVKVDGTNEELYETLETSVIASMRKEMVQPGGYTNWSVYKTHLPKDEHADFNFVTLLQSDGLENFSEMKLVESNQKITKWFESQKRPIRSIARTELWQLVEYADEHKGK